MCDVLSITTKAPFLTLLYNTILVLQLKDPRQERCFPVNDAEHRSYPPVDKRQRKL